MADTGYVAIEFFRAVAVAASTAASSRIYINESPQSAAYPHVVMSIISREPSPTQDSGSAVDTYRIQVDCYAKPSTTQSAFKVASTLADNIRVAVSRAYNEADYDQIIDSVQEANYFTDQIPDIDLFRVSNDYMVRVKPEAGVYSTITSGTYTPTITNSVDVSSMTMRQAQYMRVGSVITVSGNFTINSGNGFGESSFEMSLPVSSTIGATEDVAGVCSSITGNYQGAISGNSSNNTANVSTISEPGQNTTLSFTFTYQVI